MQAWTSNTVGVTVTDEGAYFRVWAPRAECLELYLPGDRDEVIPMTRKGDHWETFVKGGKAGLRYFYRINKTDNRPDPASELQPEGVHGPSEVVHQEYAWADNTWPGLPRHHHVFYELHVGTYTKEGTFEAIIPHLGQLKDLGVTALELMPICQFPGKRNWGYDGVFPFAPQNSYGGPAGLKKLVNAAHAHGLAVVLDVIYNHLGPEGNYFSCFAPYFTDCYRTPWGDALNFDGALSQPVRDFFLQNVEHWLSTYHIDGLRLDACHEIFDKSPQHILAAIQERVDKLEERLGRRMHIFAESDANDVRYLKPTELGGYGLDSQWLDDFHHALYSQMPESHSKRYDADYAGMEFLEKTFNHGFVYTGQYCPTRRRPHGSPSAGIPPDKFVVFIQNHDQVGNSIRGHRLADEVSFEAAKMAAATYLLSPYLPLIFMGEEYAETRPFQFFVDHSDEDLVEAVREGRQKDFLEEDDTGEFQDPLCEETFKVCILDHEFNARSGRRQTMWKFYQEALRLRRELPAINLLKREDICATWVPSTTVLTVVRRDRFGETLLIVNVAPAPAAVELGERGKWHLMLDSASPRWHGPGSQAPDQYEVGDQPAKITVNGESALLYLRQN